MIPGTMGFVPRTRRAMEAVDLGLSLLQTHWRAVAQVWMLQLALLLGLLLPFLWKTPIWILLGLWWLKPWLDRGVLFVLSRVVFGQPASVWDFLRAWRAVHRRGLLASLLWRRLSPMRSYVLPVFQLEDLRGAAYRRRARVLTRQGGGTGFLLTCSGWLFTVLTFLGFLPLIQAMVPPGTHWQIWNGFATMSTGFQWLLVALSALSLTLTEPFFVAGGFALYLNRRTHLEGWDLELVFRRLAARLLAVVLLGIGSLSLGAQEPPLGLDPEAQAPAEVQIEGPLRPEAEARQRALKILKEDPAFCRTQKIKTLQYEPSGREPTWLRSLLDALFGKNKPDEKPESKVNSKFLEGLWGLLALAAKVLLVGGLLALLLWIVYSFRHRLGSLSVSSETWEAPNAVAGLDIRPESLPPDVPAAARHLFVKGEPRAALALLYRGALAELVHRKGMEIPLSATEGDCLQAAQNHLEHAPAEIFATLTRVWQRLAYNDELPTRDAFEALCASWPGAFGGTR